MNAKQIEYFLAVCSEGSYAKAAEKLYISPQGLYKAIHKIEEELDVTLFEATGTGFVLTEYGHVLRKHGQEFLLGYERIMNEIETIKQQTDHVLNIGIKNGFADGCGENYLIDFIVENHDIKTNIRSFPMQAIHEAMKDPERQIWILPGKYDTSIFESIHVCKQKMFLLVGETHPLAQYDRIPINMIGSYPIIALPHDIGQKSVTDELVKEHVIEAPTYYLDISDRELY